MPLYDPHIDAPSKPILSTLRWKSSEWLDDDFVPQANRQLGFCPNGLGQNVPKPNGGMQGQRAYMLIRLAKTRKRVLRGIIFKYEQKLTDMGKLMNECFRKGKRPKMPDADKITPPNLDERPLWKDWVDSTPTNPADVYILDTVHTHALVNEIIKINEEIDIMTKLIGNQDAWLLKVRMALTEMEDRTRKENVLRYLFETGDYGSAVDQFLNPHDY